MSTFSIRRIIRIVAVTALSSQVASSPLLAQCSPADKAALESFDKSWGDATQRGDRAMLESVMSEHYMTVNAIGTVDKQTVLADAVRNAERNRATPAPAATADRYVITCTPLTATITHRNTFVDPGGMPVYSRSVHFLERSGGKWRVVSSTGHAVNDQQQLVYIEQDWNDATQRRDTDWFEKNYAPSATEIDGLTGRLTTKSQVIASAKTDKIVYDDLELSELSTRVDGNAAVVTGVNHVRGKDAEGKAFDRRARFTDTFIKKDGRWQVWATQSTIIP